ncbi:hypothetical protein K461DRAFT_145898 [Myriangium duriaei CBS 260.36]|uniref:Uncharacterized protein n=1 Tax=Myriangium duriaei CBS 260.36 TaxID=1168546 RepID=A0A9P4IYT4_9PEZI|nr:hypothetical protein K461DRAFT_145898 [Myriangium duriaei CBS 260.36]
MDPAEVTDNYTVYSPTSSGAPPLSPVHGQATSIGSPTSPRYYDSPPIFCFSPLVSSTRSSSPCAAEIESSGHLNRPSTNFTTSISPHASRRDSPGGPNLPLTGATTNSPPHAPAKQDSSDGSPQTVLPRSSSSSTSASLGFPTRVPRGSSAACDSSASPAPSRALALGPQICIDLSSSPEPVAAPKINRPITRSVTAAAKARVLPILRRSNRHTAMKRKLDEEESEAVHYRAYCQPWKLSPEQKRRKQEHQRDVDQQAEELWSHIGTNWAEMREGRTPRTYGGAPMKENQDLVTILYRQRSITRAYVSEFYTWHEVKEILAEKIDEWNELWLLRHEKELLKALDVFYQKIHPRQCRRDMVVEVVGPR